MTLRRPLVCLVSDRSRLSALGSARRDLADDPWAALVDLAGLAADAGVDLIQVREPDLSSRELFALVTQILERSRETSSKIVVNDRVDVALASGAGGVHLKSESIPTLVARELVPEGMLVGRSVHTVEEAVDAAGAGADYVICGTVFETRSKAPGTRPAGLAMLRAVVDAVRVPVLAIGGVTLDRLDQVAATGAAGIAAIGLFHESGALERLASSEAVPAALVRRHLEGAVTAVRRAFA